MSRLREGDRARIDPESTNGEGVAGVYGTVTEVTDDGSIAVELERGRTLTVPTEGTEPCPPLPPVLRDRELETARNIWGPDVPQDLQELDSDMLWEMCHRSSEAIERCYQDDDMEAMGVLCPLNVKVTQELARRKS